MKTQDIKDMGQALQQVQESAKAALAKKLAKASASSEKGKAAVTLPKAPFDIPKKDTKDEGYGSMVSPAAKKAIDARVAANTAALKAKGKNADTTLKDKYIFGCINLDSGDPEVSKMNSP